MKKQITVIMLALVCCLAVILCACTPDTPTEHVCQHICPECHKCLSDCDDPVCKDKCQGHQAPEHKCQHVCPECGKCTSDCQDPKCEAKCPKHVKVTKINVNTDDENDGTLASPRSITIAQGNSAEIVYNVQPRDAENKTLQWTVGTIADGVFRKAEAAKITVADNGSKITITVAADAATAVIEGKTTDGSDITVYITVEVTIYTPVTAITVGNLKPVDNADYNYELVTLEDTNWDMTDGTAPRGSKLLAGEVFGGLQAPRNLTYYANVRNIGLSVVPAEATNPDITVSYSVEGVVTIDTAGNITVLGAGETIVTIASAGETDVVTKIKVTVKEALYRGIEKSVYQAAEEAVNVGGGWNLDADHATEKQFSRYDDWHLVMVHSNNLRTVDNEDGNQKIFYMGETSRPYGICIENNVFKSSGADLTLAAGMMWAKLTVPASAITFNVKVSNNGSQPNGEYRVIFVDENGNVTALCDWKGFSKLNDESTQKLTVPEAIKGVKGAMVIEHRLTKNDVNAEFGIKNINFEGQVNVTSVVFDNDNAAYKQGERSFTITAKVRPENATNDKVTYAMAEGSAAGVTVDANGVVTVTAEALGEYRIIASAVADATKTATFTLTITADEIEVNEWTGVNQITQGVSDVKWSYINGGHDDGVGEGADLSIRDNLTYAALELADRKVKDSSFILTFGARTFVRDLGELYPKFVVYVIEGDSRTLIKGIGQTEDYFYVESDIALYCSYDLSAYIGKNVTIQIGIIQGAHGVVQSIKFTGNETNVKTWKDKTAILNADADPWTVTGAWNAGPSEGVDLNGKDSYISNQFVIGAHNAKFTFGGRIFKGQEGDKGFPQVKLVVVVGGAETVVKPIGSDSETITLNGDNVVQTSYDLSAFIGKSVEIRLVCTTEVYHCVIAGISMSSVA